MFFRVVASAFFVALSSSFLDVLAPWHPGRPGPHPPAGPRSTQAVYAWVRTFSALRNPTGYHNGLPLVMGECPGNTPYKTTNNEPLSARDTCPEGEKACLGRLCEPGPAPMLAHKLKPLPSPRAPAYSQEAGLNKLTRPLPPQAAAGSTEAHPPTTPVTPGRAGAAEPTLDAAMESVSVSPRSPAPPPGGWDANGRPIGTATMGPPPPLPAATAEPAAPVAPVAASVATPAEMSAANGGEAAGSSADTGPKATEAEAPKEAEANGEQLEPEDFDDSESFIQIAYTKDTDRSVVDKLSPPELEQFLQWYANENEIEIDISPQIGCQGKPYGPWQFYYRDFAYAQFIEQAMPKAGYDHRYDDEDGQQQIARIEFTLKAMRIGEAVRERSGMTDNFQSNYTMYTMIYLDPGWIFRNMHKRFVEEAHKEIGLTVNRCSRPQQSITVGDEKMPLGKTHMGDMINTTISYNPSSIKTFALEGRFPPKLHVEVKKQDGSIWSRGFDYSVKVGESASEELKELVKAMCPECHKVKPGTAGARSVCGCIPGKGKGKGKGKGGGKGVGKGGTFLGKRPRSEQEDEAKKELAKRSQPSNWRQDAPCKSFQSGMCGRNASCSFNHGERDGVTRADTLKVAKGIPCGHKKMGGKCVFGISCMYAKPGANAIEHAPAFQLNKALLLACTRKRRLRPNGAPRRKRYHREFDSTLGYPGEGPPGRTFPAPGSLRLVGLNANGLKSQGRVRALLATAKKRGIALLFLQEHNFKQDEMKEFSKSAEMEGFAACIGPCGNESSRGGTAILMHRDTLGLGSKTVCSRHYLGGRVTTAEVTILGQRLQLASVYAPVSGTARGSFIRGLRSLRILNRNMIVQGDFNCVPDVSVDVRHAEGSTSTYPNTHAATLETLMARHGLQDVWRTYAGRSARQFTRQGSTVFTRLDRFYAAGHARQWVWVEVGIDASFCRETWNPDHFAVTATIEPLQKSKSKPKEGRIDPDILRLPYVRRGVHEIWTAVYSNNKTCEAGHARVWEAFKRQVHAFLVGATMDSKAEKRGEPGKVAALQQQIQKLAEDAVVDRPSAARVQKVQELHAKLKEAQAKAQPARGASAWARVMREELSSRLFYKQFKARHANQNINSIYTVKDWRNPADHPTEAWGEDHTCRGGDVLQECTKYYTWLYGRKESKRPERLLAHLRKRQISESHRRMCDATITVPEVRTAVLRCGNNKSPGPDCLPAEFYKEFLDLIDTELAAVLNEAADNGELPPSMLLGEITLLYKKKDPRDVRNYRPITLLNVDYKILTKVLGARIAATLDSIISSPQTGFVPRRRISDNSHLLSLIQAYLDETDEEGLFVFQSL